MFLKPPSLWELRMCTQVKCSHWKPFSASIGRLHDLLVSFEDHESGRRYRLVPFPLYSYLLYGHDPPGQTAGGVLNTQQEPDHQEQVGKVAHRLQVLFWQSGMVDLDCLQAYISVIQCCASATELFDRIRLRYTCTENYKTILLCA